MADGGIALTEKACQGVVAEGGPTFRQSGKGFICNQTGARINATQTRAYAKWVVNSALGDRFNPAKRERMEMKKLEKAAEKEAEAQRKRDLALQLEMEARKKEPTPWWMRHW